MKLGSMDGCSFAGKLRGGMLRYLEIRGRATCEFEGPRCRQVAVKLSPDHDTLS